jgi:hypothetical protein
MVQLCWLAALGGGFVLLLPVGNGAVVRPEPTAALVVDTREPAMSPPAQDRWPGLAIELEPIASPRDESVTPLLLTLAAASLLPLGLLWQSWRTGASLHREPVSRD